MCDDVKFRYIRHLMSNSVSEIPILGFWVIFLWKEKNTNFWGCIIKLHLNQILCESMARIRSVTSEITF